MTRMCRFHLFSRRAERLLVVASVARPVVELNYKDMGAPLFLDNSLWPFSVYYGLGLNNYELRITNYELGITNYELGITNYELGMERGETEYDVWIIPEYISTGTIGY